MMIDVLRDHRRRVQTDVAGDQVHVLIVLELQIDDAVLAERGDRRAGLRVERLHAVARRDVDDPRRPSVRPVREAAARELTRRFLAALALVFAVHPLHLAGRGIERDDRAARAGGRVDPSADHQRRRLEVELRPRSEVVGLEPPGHFEFVEVVLVDLIERLDTACSRDRRRRFATRRGCRL